MEMNETTVKTTVTEKDNWFDLWFRSDSWMTEAQNDTLSVVSLASENETLATEGMQTQMMDLISTTLVTETSKIYSEFLCVQDELSEPDFPRYACSGSKITSWIATVFLLSMIIFGVVKCLTAHGIRNIFDLRLNGVSFPQRPEFFVLLCSSLPLVFTTLSRPLFTPLSLRHDIFIRGWGLAQTRFFFDLFTRTASIYHLVYWAYRTPIITLLWRIKLLIDHYHTLWQNRPKPAAKPRKSIISTKGALGVTKPQPKVTSRGRTSEHGYGKKRRRSRSTRSNRSNDKAPSQASSDQTSANNNPNSTSASNPQAPVITAGGVSVIAPQPLFPVQPVVISPFGMGGMMSSGMTGMAPYGQSAMPGTFNYSPGANGYNMYGSVPAGDPRGLNPGMGYGMGFGYGMGMGLPGQGFPQQSPASMYGMGQVNTDQSMLGMKPSGTETTNALDKLENETQNKASKPPKEPVIRPPPSRPFTIMCKRVIPGIIYLLSFVTTIPSILSFEVEPAETRFIAVRCTTMCRAYFYYDLVVLVTVPTLMMIVGFYHAALSKTQLNGGTKMTYRLRCYYVTFILLNIPMFVLMLTSIGFRLTQKPYRNIYGTGILIALTAYHANFALKSTVYTTGCNCICCTDDCLRRVPVMSRFINFFTTPVAVKDREKLIEGSVIVVQMEKDSTTTQK